MNFSLPGTESLSETEISEIKDLVRPHPFVKGTILLREGEVAKKCYFIIKGCVRQYKIVDGKEITTAFFTEQQAVVSFTSYINDTPADHWLECAEDCEMLEGDRQSEKEMYERFPKVAEITRNIMSADFGKAQSEMAAFMVAGPEERYKNILENRPELLQRVPQHQIASLICVTPESLSRIRKRMTLKDRN